ncbi:MAG: hypothetical protein WAO98_05620 [Alphaproteobacteria bacterium]
MSKLFVVLVALFVSTSVHAKDLPFEAHPAYPLVKGTVGTEMVWLNNDDLVFQKRNFDQKTKRAHDDLSMWSFKTKATTFFVNFVGPWCAANNVIAYTLSRQSLGSGKFSLKMVHYTASGNKTYETGDLSAAYVRGPYISALISEHSASRFTSPEKFNLFDCSWLTSKEFAALYSADLWGGLRPGDGAIAFKTQPDSKNPKHPVMKAIHYKMSGEAIELPVAAPGLNIGSVRYHDFRKAYFLTVRAQSKINPQNGNCQTAWWFDAKQNRVEQICAPGALLDKYDPIYLPTQKGLLRMFGKRDAPVKGIYLTNDKGQTTKIWNGSAFGGAVSPDGCKVAVNASKPFVLDICK